MSDKRAIIVEESCWNCPRMKDCKNEKWYGPQRAFEESCPLPKWPSISRDDLAKHVYGKNLKELSDYWADDGTAAIEECLRVIDGETAFLKSKGMEMTDAKD